MLHWSLKDFHNIYTHFMRFLVLALLLSGYMGAGFYYILHRPTSLSQEMVLKVRRGQNLHTILAALEQKGIISSQAAPWLKTYVWLFKSTRPLKTGDYLIKPYASSKKIVDTLLKGHGLSYWMTIPEGLTNLQILELLERFSFLEEDHFELPAEGFLFPDTYKVRGGVGYSKVFHFMQHKMLHTLMEVWKNRASDLYLKTPEEALILASLIEKETRVSEEMPRIAGVFINRLRKNMKLQSDPTTIYGLSAGTGSLGRPLKRSDLLHPSDYNTYYIKGLPPIPICNPGLQALKAATHPEKNNYYYFVINGTGGHNFSTHYHDHQKHIKNLKKLKNSQKK